MAIATIGHWDWPEKWQNLVEDLVNCLKGDNEHLVQGAIRCLDMFADGDNLTDEHLPQLMRLLLPELLRIASSSQVYCIYFTFNFDAMSYFTCLYT
jgi:hypothetical protein